MTIKVKDLVEFLLTKDQEMEVILDRNGWETSEGDTSSAQEIIDRTFLFSTFTFEGKSTLIIEN